MYISHSYGNTDFGTDRCVRNSTEAFLCYKSYLDSVYYNIGWPKSVVQKLVNEAQKFSSGKTAAVFWKETQQRLLGWIKATGYSPTDLPKFDKVMGVLQSYSEGAFSWSELQKDLAEGWNPSSIFDAEDFWKSIPIHYKIAGGAIIGLIVLSQVAAVARATSDVAALAKRKK